MSTSNNEFGAVRIMLDYACYWGLPFDIRQTLEKELPTQFFAEFDTTISTHRWHIGDWILFREEKLALQLCTNGGNMRRTFWEDVLPNIAHNLIGSIIFAHADSPSSFRQLRAMLHHNYSYDPESGLWGLFMSPPIVAFKNTYSPDAWSIDDIKLYLREYPNLNCIAFEPDNLFSITSLLIYALEHCANYLSE